jgi:glycerol-3-phosphate acyltransferase PlsX
MLGEEFAAMAGESARQAVEAFGHFRARVDYSEYGGAPLLGVGRPVVVGHGRSSAKAVCNAIRMAAAFARGGLVPRLEEELLNLQGTPT